MKYLNKCFYECHDETEFQVSWDDMINKFSLGDHLWLKKLYSLRDKWCLVFNSDTFSANIDFVRRSDRYCFPSSFYKKDGCHQFCAAF